MLVVPSTVFLADWACETNSFRPAEDDLSMVFSVSSKRRDISLISSSLLAVYEGEAMSEAIFSRFLLRG